MQDDIRKLLEENKKLNKEINESVIYIRKYIFFSKVFGVIKILIIVIPLILSFIYLPGVIGNAMSKEGGVFNQFDMKKFINCSYNSLNGEVDIDNLTKEDIEFIKTLREKAILD